MLSMTRLCSRSKQPQREINSPPPMTVVGRLSEMLSTGIGRENGVRTENEPGTMTEQQSTLP